jgi:hypothetical protein
LSDITCFMLEPTDRLQIRFRRYRGGSDCKRPDGKPGYHNADIALPAEYTAPVDAEGRAHGFGRKPTADELTWVGWEQIATCKRCGYTFEDADPFQVNGDLVYRRTDTGEDMTLLEAPAGAMWYADWYPGKGPDGHCLAVKLPNGTDWLVDAPSSSGGNWTRTGEPPNVTAQPSIGSGDPADPNYYHGFLRDGKLVDA